MEKTDMELASPDYKLLVDPALRKGTKMVKRTNGIVLGCEDLYPPVEISDPRFPELIRRPRKFAMDLPVPNFRIDKNFIGKPPLVQVTILNLNDNVDKSFLDAMLLKFGPVEKSKILYHPGTKKHMEAAAATFKNVSSAKKCVEHLNNLSVMGKTLNVFLDPFEKEYRNVLEKALTSKHASAKEKETPDRISRDPRLRENKIAEKTSVEQTQRIVDKYTVKSSADLNVSFKQSGNKIVTAQQNDHSHASGKDLFEYRPIQNGTFLRCQSNKVSDVRKYFNSGKNSTSDRNRHLSLDSRIRLFRDQVMKTAKYKKQRELKKKCCENQSEVCDHRKVPSQICTELLSIPPSPFISDREYEKWSVITREMDSDKLRASGQSLHQNLRKRSSERTRVTKKKFMDTRVQHNSLQKYHHGEDQQSDVESKKLKLENGIVVSLNHVDKQPENKTVLNPVRSLATCPSYSEFTSQQQSVSHSVTSQTVSKICAPYVYPEQYNAHLTRYGNQYYFNTYVGPTSYAPPGSIPQYNNTSVQYVPSMTYYSGQYVQPLPSVYGTHQGLHPPIFSNSSESLGKNVAPCRSASYVKCTYLERISVADFDILTKSILQLLIPDLKQVLKKDVYKRMLYIEAFKVTEEWLKNNQIKFQRKIKEKSGKCSTISTVPWDVMSRYIEFNHCDVKISGVNKTICTYSSPLSKLPEGLKQKYETVASSVSGTRSKRPLQTEKEKHRDLSLSTGLLDLVNPSHECSNGVNYFQGRNSSGKCERDYLNGTGTFGSCIGLDLTGDMGIVRDKPLWTFGTWKEHTLGDENRKESEKVGCTEKERRGRKRSLSVVDFKHSGLNQIREGDNVDCLSNWSCRNEDCQGKPKLNEKCIPSCLSAIEKEPLFIETKGNEKMGKSCEETGILNGNSPNERCVPGKPRDGRDCFLQETVFKEIENSSKTPKNEHPSENFSDSTSIRADPVKKLKYSGLTNSVSDCNFISMSKWLAAYSKCDLEVKQTLVHLSDNGHLAVKNLPLQSEKISSSGYNSDIQVNSNKRYTTNLNLLEPCQNVIKRTTAGCDDNAEKVDSSQHIVSEPSCNKTIENEVCAVLSTEKSEGTNEKLLDVDQFSSTDECDSDQETVMAESGDELWNWCSDKDSHEITGDVELSAPRFKREHEVVDVKVLGECSTFTEQDTGAEDLSPSSVSTENVSHYSSSSLDKKPKPASKKPATSARKKRQYSTKKLRHMIRVNLKLKASFLVKRRKTSKCKRGGNSASKKNSARKKKQPRTCKVHATKAEHLNVFNGGLTNVSLKEVKTDSKVEEDISEKSQGIGAHNNQVMEASQALIALASSFSDSDKGRHVMQKIQERGDNKSQSVSSVKILDFNSSPASCNGGNFVNLDSRKQLIEEHSYCLPMIVHTNDRQYVEVPVVQRQSRNYQFEQRQKYCAKQVYKKRRLSEEIDVLHSFQHLGIDEEDVNFLKQGYDRLLCNDELDWLKSIRWDGHPTTPVESGEIEHASSSARTEVFQRKSNIEKFLDFLNSGSQQSENDRCDVSLQVSKMIAQSNRETKCFQRRLLNLMVDADCTVSSDLLKLNQLKFRKKHLKFARSKIHNFGLFAGEPICPDEMVIEYVGEKIRPVICDLRERKYAQVGIGSSYMFRIDSETVIDATKWGNFARFINHSCSPNCYAKIITVEGQKKIVIYSKVPIGVNEEITYDYKFPIEEEKIPCFCMSSQCRGYLN